MRGRRNHYAITFAGRRYEGWYECAADAVYGAMMKDRFDGFALDLVVDVRCEHLSRSGAVRTTPGLKRIVTP
jgi:hypothetical protein